MLHVTLGRVLFSSSLQVLHQATSTNNETVPGENALPAVFYYINYVTGGITILGSLLIIFCFIFIPVLRKHPNTMLFWNALSDMTFAIFLLVMPFLRHLFPAGSVQCQVAASAYQFLSLASVTWNFVIGLDLFLLLRNPFAGQQHTKVKILGKMISASILYHIFVWSVCLVTCVLLYIDRTVHPTEDGICWTKSPFQLVNIIPVYIYVFFSIIFVIYATRKLLRTGLPESLVNRLNIVVRLVIYTIFFVILWSGPLVSRTINFIAGLSPEVARAVQPASTILNGIDYISETSMSILDVVIFGTHPAILNFICFCRKKKSNKEVKEQKYYEMEETITPYGQLRSTGSQGSIQLSEGLLGATKQDGVANVQISFPSDLERGGSKIRPTLNNMQPDLLQADPFTKIEENNELLMTNRPRTRTRRYSLQSQMVPSNSLGVNIDAAIRRDMMFCIMLGVSQTVLDSEKLEINEDLAPQDFSAVYTKRIRRAPLSSEASISLKLSESVASMKSFIFVEYAPKAFRRIRQSYTPKTALYLKSFDPNTVLEKFIMENFSEGKSGSFFCRTHDNKMVVKTISNEELQTLLKVLPQYMKYLTSNMNTLISKVLGVYSISMYDGVQICFMVMNNVLDTKRSIDERYDLKGSWINRKAFKDKKPKKGLGMDLDVKEKFIVGATVAKNVSQQIIADSNFLSSVGIMDYSLLVGVHHIRTEEQASVVESTTGAVEIKIPAAAMKTDNGYPSEDGSKMYYFGIIDILQEYTFAKKAEKAFKQFVLRKDGLGISSQPPTYYALRFQSRITQLLQ